MPKKANDQLKQFGGDPSKAVLIGFLMCSSATNVFLFAITPGASTEPSEVGLNRACLNRRVTNPNARISGPQLRELRAIQPYDPNANQIIQTLLGSTSYCKIPDGVAQVNGQQVKVSRYASPTIWDRDKAIALLFDTNSQRFVGVQELNFFELPPVHVDDSRPRNNFFTLSPQAEQVTLMGIPQQSRRSRGLLATLFGSQSSCN